MAYLASQSDGCAGRSEVAGWLWSERDAAASRQALRQCMFRLRNWLGDRAQVLEADREALRLNLGEVEIDSRDLEELMRDKRCFDPIAAARLCQGSFCAGLDVAEEPVEQWLRRRRGELDRLAARAFAGAAEHAAARADADTAIEFASQRVALDPFDETAQASLIGICMHFGRYGQARAVYQACRKEFRDELGVAPGQSIEAALEVRPPPNLVPSPAVSVWVKGRRQGLASRARVDRKDPGLARLTGAVAASLLAAVLFAGEWGRIVEREDAPVTAARMWVSAEDVSSAPPAVPVSKEVADHADRVALEVAPAEALRRALRGEAQYAQFYPTGC